MRIWELNTISTGYTPFYLPNENEIEIFATRLEEISDENKSILNDWEPLVLLKEEQQIDPDFFDLYDTGSLIVSLEGAATIMLSLPEEDYELLPFLNDEKKYFLFNLIRSTDCLDKNNSIYNSFENGVISDYDGLMFDYDKMIEKPIFKIPELPYTLFVTHVFEYLCNMENLKGINFSDDNLIFVD